MSDRLLTVKQAAERLAIAPGTLRHWVSSRRIECVRIGRNITRFRPDTLDRLIADSTQKDKR